MPSEITCLIESLQSIAASLQAIKEEYRNTMYATVRREMDNAVERAIRYREFNIKEIVTNQLRESEIRKKKLAKRKKGKK
jgi:hypothetical protein